MVANAATLDMARDILPEELPQLRESIRKQASRILENQAALGDIVGRHQATLQRRWSKMSKQKRRHILLEVWPGMSLDHRPDLADILLPHTWNEAGNSRPCRKVNREACLMPWINQFDLSKDEPLPLLLNSRSRHPPHVFVYQDMLHFSYASKAELIIPRRVEGYTFEFKKTTRPDDIYGELVPVDTSSGSSHTCCTACTDADIRCLAPGVGLFILEVQDRVYRFLLETSWKILHDIPPAQLTGPDYPIQQELPPISANAKADVHYTLAVTHLESSYLAPGQTDFARMKMLVDAKVLEAEDGFLALQEDPQSFARAFQDYLAHSHEFMTDANGKIDVRTTPEGFREWRLKCGDGKFQESGISTMQERIANLWIVWQHNELSFWDELAQVVNDVVILKAQHFDGTDIAPGDPLPTDFAMALYRLQHVLVLSLRWRARTLPEEVIMASPPLRRYIARPSPCEPRRFDSNSWQSSFRIFTDAPNNVMSLLVIMDLFSETTCLGQVAHSAQLQSALNIWDRFCEVPGNLDLVSPRVGDYMTTIALLSECLRQLQLFHPWSLGFAHEMSKPHVDERLMSEWRTRNSSALIVWLPGSLARQIVHLSGLDYPSHKKRSKTSVEAMRAAEEKLDTFWSNLRRHQDTGGLGPGYKRALIGQGLVRTPAWEDPVVRPTQGQPTAGNGVASLGHAFQNLHLETKNLKQSLDVSEKKSKTKTRGIPTPGSASHNDEKPVADTTDAEQEDEHPVPAIKVDKRSLRVFSALFFSSTSDPQKGGEKSWKEFVHAMKSAGFTAEKPYGSAWQFTATSLDGVQEGQRKSIMIHEPHPEPKISLWLARRLGRRLNRAFGWTLETFELK